ncbi:hypothetical protein GQ43DRAFT_437619 [Delitschia confertaspora ATCC 74209]|uniref:Uncharacterized protein n=1 Tax=Delitschia confertaspora ATCC 74209 TaxID=1513339 RepID=A0A9P4JTE8_9PLEO|nr:hypothetical protein GQ43DRAFT_437619 [Delitschia confertaspora ATCC 74209]
MIFPHLAIASLTVGSVTFLVIVCSRKSSIRGCMRKGSKASFRTVGLSSGNHRSVLLMKRRKRAFPSQCNTSSWVSKDWAGMGVGGYPVA